MPEFTVTLDTSAARFYRRVAGAAGLSVEQVLSDALFKLASELASWRSKRWQKSRKNSAVPLHPPPRRSESPAKASPPEAALRTGAPFTFLS